MITIRIDSLKDVSDGYHTFQDLYDHRHALLIALLKSNLSIAFKTRKTSEGNSYEGWFIAGLNTHNGQISYHLPDEYWDYLSEIQEIDSNFKYDGHTSEEVKDRLLTLF